MRPQPRSTAIEEAFDAAAAAVEEARAGAEEARTGADEARVGLTEHLRDRAGVTATRDQSMDALRTIGDGDGIFLGGAGEQRRVGVAD